MSAPGRVTYLVTSSSTGGAQRQVHDLALAMQARGWEVSVVSMLPVEQQFADLPAAGVPTTSLGMRRGLADPRALFRLRRILQETRPDVLHAHMVHANLLARACRPLVHVPVLISTMHNQHQGARWRHLAYRATDRLTDVTTAVSTIALDDAAHQGIAPRDRLMLLANGIDATAYRADAATRARVRRELGIEDAFLWLAVGRLVEAKDFPTMIEAMARRRQEQASSRLVIAGDGPLEAQLRARVEAAGLGSWVTLLGLRSDVPALMQAADGFLMSSAWEGLPIVLLEAGASRLPIVATYVGGSADAVLDGVTGHLVAPGDPASLAGAMARVETMPEPERTRMGLASRDRVIARFDMGSVSARWDDLYRRLLGQARLAERGLRSVG